jgi:hypothetical protein
MIVRRIGIEPIIVLGHRELKDQSEHRRLKWLLVHHDLPLRPRNEQLIVYQLTETRKRVRICIQ